MCEIACEVTEISDKRTDYYRLFTRIIILEHKSPPDWKYCKGKSKTPGPITELTREPMITWEGSFFSWSSRTSETSLTSANFNWDSLSILYLLIIFIENPENLYLNEFLRMSSELFTPIIFYLFMNLVIARVALRGGVSKLEVFYVLPYWSTFYWDLERKNPYLVKLV